jgi:PAS domain S-box-containing protein
VIGPASRGGKVVARTFPTHDVVFAERVEELLGRERRSDPERIAAGIASKLRAVHENVKATVRTEVAGFGETVIYVFRDGSASPAPDETPWTDDAGTARVVSDAAGTYVAANEAAARLFGRPIASIIGEAAGTFTRPDARIEDRDALWHMLDRTGRLHSLAIVRCDDGSETPVEFVTVKDADGPGRNVTYLRERH